MAGGAENSEDLDMINRLFEAIKAKNASAVEAVLQERSELVNTKCKTRLGLVTPLLAACAADSLDVVKILLRNGADVSISGLVDEPTMEESLPTNVGKVRGGHGSSDDIFPLSIATRHENVNIVQELLRAGASVNQTNGIGQSALHVGCMKYNLIESRFITEPTSVGPVEQGNAEVAWEVAKCLVENGANVNLQDANGRTPINYACDDGNFYIVKLLLEHGADITIRDNSGLHALNIAAHYDYQLTMELIRLPNLPVIDVIEAYETIAFAPICRNRFEIMLKATQMRVEHNIPKTVMEPKECYGNAKEWETAEELQVYKDDELQLQLQAFLARERIFDGRHVHPISEPALDDFLQIPNITVNAILKHQLELFKKNNDYLYFAETFVGYLGLLARLLGNPSHIDLDALTELAKVAIESSCKVHEALQVETRAGVIRDLINEIEQTILVAGIAILELLKSNKKSNNAVDPDQNIAKGLLRDLCHRIPVVVVPATSYKCPLTHILFSGKHFEVNQFMEYSLPYRYDLMKLLVDAGFNVNMTDSNGNTLLHVIISTWPHAFDWLKHCSGMPEVDENNEEDGENDGDLDDDLNHDPVIASSKSTENIIKLLLENGIYMHARNKNKQTAQDLLRNHHNQEPFSLMQIIDLMDRYDEFPSLKRIAAIRLSDCNIEYQNKIPKALEQFVNLH